MESQLEFTWFGHATWRLRVGGQTLWIDPFLNDNPSSPCRAQDVDSCNAILITHGHFDHIADAAELANRFQATVIANYEIVQWLSSKHGVSGGIGMNVGGNVSVAGVTIKMVPAIHSSSLPDGSYGGLASGFLIKFGGRCVYFAGDTGLYSDMARLASHIDVAVVPIGDLFTMGPQDSLEAIRLTQAKLALPSHFNTWPPIAQDVNQWISDVKQGTKSQGFAPVPGQPIRL